MSVALILFCFCEGLPNGFADVFYCHVSYVTVLVVRCPMVSANGFRLGEGGDF